MPSHGRNQTGPKRNETQRQRDRKRIAQLHALGYSQRAITAQLATETVEEGYTVNEMTVSRDLKAVKEEWRSARIEDIQSRRTQQQAQLDFVIFEAVKAYEFSKRERRQEVLRPQNTMSDVTSLDGEASGASLAGDERRTVGEIDRLPEWRYLSVLMDALKRTAKLWGLDVRPDELGVGGTGTPAPDPKRMPYEDANVLLMTLVGQVPGGGDGSHAGQ